MRWRREDDLIARKAAVVITNSRWQLALVDPSREPPGAIRDLIEHHDEVVRRSAVAGVLALCEEWDRISKGETPTTARIRAAINGPAAQESEAS